MTRTTLVAPGDVLPPLTLTNRGVPFKPPAAAKGTIFYFMRTADCPVCRAHVRRLAQLWPSLERAGFAVVVVVNDPGGSSAVSLSTPFPIVSGTQAHREVGLERVLFGLVQQSGTVVVDASNVIVKLVRATTPTAAFPEDEVLALAGL